MVAIVIVHYQNLADTIRCVESLRKLEDSNFRIIIIDNCSPNQSGLKLKETLTDCEVILSKSNMGFAAACNIGVKAANGANYIWLLNPDTTVATDALTKLLEAAIAYPDVAAFGSKILYGNDLANKLPGDTIWSAGACINLKTQTLKMIGNNEEDKGQYYSNSDCDYLPGCSIFASAKVFETPLPEQYFMYFEETDWCFSLKLAGQKLMYVASSVVYHHTKDEKMQSAFNVYYYNRNQMFFWYKFSTPFVRIRTIYTVVFNKLPKALYALSKAPKS
jgi:GT2 family glycosyltransferase